MLKKLPIGIQTFSDIRSNNYIYIDKTKIAYDLINDYKYIFLSRPRRFGKSLFLDTLKNIFERNREFFEGLYIYDKWDWDVKYPVITVSFSGVRSKEELISTIFNILDQNQKKLGIECKITQDYAICFNDLIRKAYEKYNKKVVILIDEYDKPILDNLDQKDVALEAREILKRFYTEIKNSDAFVRFAFLTGVSKFSKVSLFSGLNNLMDISLNPSYATICGYMQYDIETSFIEHLQDVDFEKLKEWYNGYNFLGESVYNPYDILLFIANHKMYKNYWFETGTPAFLIKLIKEQNYFLPKLTNIKVGEELLNSFNIEDIKLETILFQTGYLTVDKMVQSPRGKIEYILRIPNKEVQISLNDALIDYLTNLSTEKSNFQDDLYEYLINTNLNAFRDTLISLFAAIPYNNYVNNNISDFEGYYASVVYVYLASLGFETAGEDVTSRGRIDITIKTLNAIYIIELKVTDEDPLLQIKTKRYYEKYLKEGKEIYLVGIKFDKEKRNIKEFVWEKVE